MTKSIVPILLVAGLAAAAPLHPGGRGGARSELDGKWVVTEARTLGGIDQPHLVNTVIVVAGDQYTATARATSRGRIKVDAKASPKRLEFAPQTPDGKPVAGKPGRWIYERDGDELRMASFTDSDGSVPERIDPTDRKQMIWKARRVKD